MPLSDIAVVNIDLLTRGLSQVGFGVPLILGYSSAWAERTRTYSDMDGVAGDFADTTPEYKAANAIFSQSPAPTEIMIGRGALKPTMKWEIEVATVANSTVYGLILNGTAYTFTSDASATNDEIIAGLHAAIGAAATAAGFTSAVAGVAPSTYQTITANSAGNWASLSLEGYGHLLKLKQAHADPGVATDLNAIELENPDWYALVTLFNSSAVITASAAWCESRVKVYLCDSQATEIATVAQNIATDVFKALQTANYARTFPLYHPDNGSFAAAAFAGKWLPYAPGSETAAFKTLAGVSTYTLTTTWKTNIHDKDANIYYEVAGRSFTWDGRVSAAEFLDVIRFRDWLQIRMQERIALLLLNNAKVPFTDTGIGLVENEIRAQLDDGVLVGGLDPSGITVTVPKATAVPVLDRAARHLTGVKFSARLAGAIHKVTINGTLTV